MVKNAFLRNGANISILVSKTRNCPISGCNLPHRKGSFGLTPFVTFITFTTDTRAQAYVSLGHAKYIHYLQVMFPTPAIPTFSEKPLNINLHVQKAGNNSYICQPETCQSFWTKQQTHVTTSHHVGYQPSVPREWGEFHRPSFKATGPCMVVLNNITLAPIWSAHCRPRKNSLLMDNSQLYITNLIY